MMNLWKAAVLVAFAIIPAGTAHSDDAPSMQGILSIAKMAGACGILQQTSAFQATTKLEGGDEFVQRFWTTEAARLGKTPDEYIASCNEAISAYEKLWQAAGAADGA